MASFTLIVICSLLSINYFDKVLLDNSADKQNVEIFQTLPNNNTHPIAESDVFTDTPDYVTILYDNIRQFNNSESYHGEFDFNSSEFKSNENFDSNNSNETQESEESLDSSLLTTEFSINNNSESQALIREDRRLKSDEISSHEIESSEESLGNTGEKKESLISMLFNEFEAKNGEEFDMTPDQKFIALINKLRNAYKMVMKDVTPLIVGKILTANISVECFTGLAKAYSALNNNEEWVVQMLDSSGHFPSGLISGTLTSLGDYEQCLRVRSDDSEIAGKYCFLNLKTELPEKKGRITFKDRYISLNGTDLMNTWIDSFVVKNMYNFYYFSITNGICVPSSCGKNDLVNLAQLLLGPFHLDVEIENCRTRAELLNQELTKGQSIALTVILGLTSVALLATVFEAFFIPKTVKYRNIVPKVIQCFSLRYNFKKFFDTSGTGSAHKRYEYNLRFFNGIKVLSMIWVIIGHTYISGAIFFNKDIPTANFYRANLYDTINMPKQWFTQFVINALLAVETFFFVSGFLIVYLAVCKFVHDNRSLNFELFVFLRWIRFVPLLVAMISFNLLWPLLGSGPLFHEDYTKFMTDPCYNYWWRNLLFISNWYPPEEQCMIHTWYMSADLQFYLVAFFLIKLTSSSVKKGIVACSTLVAMGIVIPAIVSFYYELPPSILYQADIEDMALQTSLMHYTTQNHMTPYFAGSLVACLILSKEKLYINKFFECILWLITGLGMPLVVFFTYVWSSLEWEYTRLEAALYFGFHRFIWSFGLAWITYNCAQRRAGIINSILSSNAFKLTARLTFSMYLSHMIVLWYNFFRTKHLFVSSHYDMLFTATGVYGFTMVFAFVNHLLFEAPVLNLVKYFIDLTLERHNNSKKVINKSTSSDLDLKSNEINRL